jgi:predicted nucleic-acid-binding protein
VIALDTNVLVRHLYQRDDPAQSRAANRVVAAAIAAGETALISAVVLAETALVLRRIYRLSRGGLVQAFETLWNDPAFTLEHRGLVRAALDLFKHGRADFNDYLIGQIAKQAGATTMYTFDRGLHRARGFTWLRAG